MRVGGTKPAWLIAVEGLVTCCQTIDLVLTCGLVATCPDMRANPKPETRNLKPETRKQARAGHSVGTAMKEEVHSPSPSHSQSTLDAVYLYVVPWSEFPIVHFDVEDVKKVSSALLLSSLELSDAKVHAP